jgi:hypothetical protein
MTPAPIRAQPEGDHFVSTGDIAVCGADAISELCRRLVKSGVDPATPLECYRRNKLELRVTSIKQGARQ